MSVACPCIASDAGGNGELIDSKYIFKKKDYLELINVIKNIDNDMLVKQAIINFNKAKEYNSIILNNKRNEFYKKCFNSNI